MGILRFLVLPAISITLSSNLNGEKPFDFASTPGKLPKQVVPEEYAIRIAPDMAKLTFAGSEKIKLNVRAPVQQLVFNALEMEIKSARVNEKSLPKTAIKIDPKQETVTISLPAELGVGTHTLGLDFSGKINQQGQGLFYIRIKSMGQERRK